MGTIQKTSIKQKIINDKNLLHRLYDLWSSKLLEENVFFFFLDINLCTFFINDKHENFFSDFEGCERSTINILNFFSEIEFIECIQGAFEIDKSKIIHLHAVIGFRSHFNSVQFVCNKLEKILTDHRVGNYKLSFLKDFKEITNSLRYLSKDFQKKRPFNYAFIGVYSAFFKKIHSEVLEQILDSRIFFFENRTFFNIFESYNKDIPFGKHNDIGLISKDIKNREVFELVFFLNYYLIKEHFIFFKENLYKKKLDFLISYDFVDNYSAFVSKNFLSIISSLKENDFEFINTIRFSALFSEHLGKILEQLKTLLNNTKKELCFDLLEFKDGIYLATSDIFLNKFEYKNLYLLDKNYFTTRNYDAEYTNLDFKNLDEFKWKTKLNTNLINNVFFVFCKEFRNILFCTTNCYKESMLFVSGVSNTSKFELIRDIVLQSYGFQHIDFFSLDSKTSSKLLTEKYLVVIEEQSIKKDSLHLIKSFCFNNLKENKTKMLYLSNSSKEIAFDCESQLVFYFNNACILTKKEYEEILKEIPKILVFCNKEYFKTNKTNQKLFLEISSLIK